MSKSKLVTAVAQTAAIKEVEAEKILDAMNAICTKFLAESDGSDESVISISEFITSIAQMANVTESKAEKILNTAVTVAAASF